MRTLHIFCWLIGAVGCGRSIAAELPSQPKTAAAVIAADDAWGEAEKKGDAAFVEQLLVSDYRSIGADGKVTTKAMIVEHTRTRGASSEYAQKVDDWKAAHPEHAEVVISGDTAILTWVADQAPAGRIASCDVFVFRSGRWHGVYSQHTSALL